MLLRSGIGPCKLQFLRLLQRQQKKHLLKNFVICVDLLNELEKKMHPKIQLQAQPSMYFMKSNSVLQFFSFNPFCAKHKFESSYELLPSLFSKKINKYFSKCWRKWRAI